MAPLKIETPTPADITIAQSVTPAPIAEIAARLGLSSDDYEPQGHVKAKVCVGGAAAPQVAPAACCCLRLALQALVAALAHLRCAAEWRPAQPSRCRRRPSDPGPNITARQQVRLEVREKLKDVPNGKYVVVAGITPTPLVS